MEFCLHFSPRRHGVMLKQSDFIFFLGAFTKLRKENIPFIVTVCLSACNNSAPNGQIFIKFDIRVYFENLLRNLKFL